MGVNFIFVERAFSDLLFQIRQRGLQFQAIFGFDAFTNQAQSVTVGNGLVVVVAVNILAEDVTSFVFAD